MNENIDPSLGACLRFDLLRRLGGYTLIRSYDFFTCSGDSYGFHQGERVLDPSEERRAHVASGSGLAWLVDDVNRRGGMDEEALTVDTAMSYDLLAEAANAHESERIDTRAR